MKRSAQSSTQRRLENFVIVLDENLSSRRIIAKLLGHELPVHPQTDFVPRGATDPELVKALSGHPNIGLITRDEDFRYKAGTVEVLKTSKVGVFVLTGGGNRRAEEIADIIIRAWSSMCRIRSKNDTPFVARVSPDGTVTLHH